MEMESEDANVFALPFDLFRLPLEMQHHAFWVSIPTEMRLEVTPLALPGQAPWSYVVSCANARQFEIINKLHQVSRGMKAMAQELLTRAMEKKLVLLLDCTNRRTWTPIIAQSWTTLPPAFTSEIRIRDRLSRHHIVGPPHLRLVLPVQFFPRKPRQTNPPKPYEENDLVGVLTINISRRTTHGRKGKTTHPWRLESHTFSALKLPTNNPEFGGLKQLKAGITSMVRVIRMYASLLLSSKDTISEEDLIAIRERVWGPNEFPGWESQYGPDAVKDLEWRKAHWWQAMDAYEELTRRPVVLGRGLEMPEDREARVLREGRDREFGTAIERRKRRGSI